MKIHPKTIARAQSIVDAIRANVDAYGANRIDHASFDAQQRILWDLTLSPVQKARLARGETACCLVGDRNPTSDAVLALLRGEVLA